MDSVLRLHFHSFCFSVMWAWNTVPPNPLSPTPRAHAPLHTLLTIFKHFMHLSVLSMAPNLLEWNVFPRGLQLDTNSWKPRLPNCGNITFKAQQPNIWFSLKKEDFPFFPERKMSQAMECEGISPIAPWRAWKRKVSKRTSANGIVKMGAKTTAVFSLNSWNCSSWELLFSASGVLLSLVK